MAKLKIMSARSMHEPLTALAYGFTSATGHEVELSFGTVGGLQQRLDAGETADVVISSGPSIVELRKKEALVPDSVNAIATTHIAVAVREGANRPDISTPEAFRDALLAARSIAFTDAAVGGSAGVYLARLFDAMGLTETIRAKGMPQQSGAEVAMRVALGDAEIGMTLLAEIVAVPGAQVVGPLPAPLANETTYCAAVMASSSAQKAAQAFIAALIAEDARETWTAAGFERPT